MNHNGTPSLRKPNKTHKRRIALSAMAAVTAFGVIRASAATLGGITTTAIGADAVVIASCDTDGVTVTYTNAYDATTGVYRTTTVAVTSINVACNTKAIAVTLKDGAGTSIGTGSGTVAAGAASLALTPTASSTSVAGIAIVISG